MYSSSPGAIDQDTFILPIDKPASSQQSAAIFTFENTVSPKRGIRRFVIDRGRSVVVDCTSATFSSSIMFSTADIIVDNHTSLAHTTITSLHEECSQLRSRLQCLRGFSKYSRLVVNKSTQSGPTEPFIELWDLFALGFLLCHIFDQLPEEKGFNKISYSPSALYTSYSCESEETTLLRRYPDVIDHLPPSAFEDASLTAGGSNSTPPDSESYPIHPPIFTHSELADHPVNEESTQSLDIVFADKSQRQTVNKQTVKDLASRSFSVAKRRIGKATLQHHQRLCSESNTGYSSLTLLGLPYNLQMDITVIITIPFLGGSGSERHITIHCRSKDQCRQWQSMIVKLGEEIMQHDALKVDGAGRRTTGDEDTSTSAKHPLRLIDTRTCKLVDFTENEHIPAYAILSHRWFRDQEVQYEDFLELQPETRKKLGYRRIRGACKQAFLDGHNYIWIDTCCINQNNADEVSRNINSMYFYYHNSTVCYAYLVDVYTPKYKHESSQAGLWSHSKWFTRGWSLQELLAPRKVVFFNADWELIGDKAQLKYSISRLTGIPRSVLDGSSPIEDVNIEERMTWCAGRQTTKPPDLAYCLLGILGVFMVPDYTEDARTAFQRLQRILVRCYPYRFRGFQGDDIYSLLLRENARARIETEQSLITEQNNAVTSYARVFNQDSLMINSDLKHFITTTSTVEVGAFIRSGQGDSTSATSV
ncbi:hypothetical protein D9758_003400 [Tetrapyrgos nigripes]|uniref:Heterokaryon incompatibility domain-containing protein n=1 Tax=Tetrapyrgos nigripes TaxID=182062 RepID=A0A8H5GVF9_9AGAR|nr:hypothetical protein D9758_003400 [Tetrapyrgos nigripes]